MITTSYSQICLCGRSFDNAGAFTRHKKTCLRGKKHLANALSHAKESYRTKKCHVEGSEETVSSSHTESSRAVSYTTDGVLGGTPGVSDPVHVLLDTLHSSQTKGPNKAPASEVDKVWPGTLFFFFLLYLI